MTSGLSQTALFGFVGGMVLFLYGISRLSEGLQRLAGGRLRAQIFRLVKNRLAGGSLGLAAAMLTHSSTAAAIMTIGFVNAGMVALVDAIPVLLGTMIGASLTLQLVTLSPSWVLIPLFVTGLLCRTFKSRLLLRDVGETFFGLSLLMLGLVLMTSAVDLLRGHDTFRHLLLTVGDRLWLCLLLGALLSAAVQSSTAVVGMSIALAGSGILSFSACVGLMLGANLGACVGVYFAAIGLSLAARRTAIALCLMNAGAVVVVLIVLPLFLQLVGSLSIGEADYIVQGFDSTAGDGGKPYIARHLANANTLYALLCFVTFAPFSAAIARLTAFWGRESEAASALRVQFIDDRVLNTPFVALGQARAELRRMARIARESLEGTLRYMRQPSVARLESLTVREQTLDLLHKEITDFLVALSQRTSTPESSEEIVRMMHITSDLERIGDYCQTLLRLTRRKEEWRVRFSPLAEYELREMADKTQVFLSLVVDAVEAGDPSVAEMAQAAEDEIDQLEERLRGNHISRLNTGECAVRPGLIFIDMIQSLEKISDHTFHIARRISREAG